LKFRLINESLCAANDSAALNPYYLSKRITAWQFGQLTALPGFKSSIRTGSFPLHRGQVIALVKFGLALILASS
jgi:hypothetical protein